jgi:hypothetical protein
MNTDQILCIHQILENKWEYKERVHQLFIGFNKAYDSGRRKVLYSILVQFGLHVKPVRLIKVCVNKTYRRVRIGKYLFDTFPIQNSQKHGDALKPLLFKFALEYSNTKV